MQAELAALEARLDYLTKEDSMHKNENKQRYATQYQYLARSQEDPDQDQLKVAMLIRVKLRDYSESSTLRTF